MRTCPKEREAGDIAPGTQVRHSHGGIRLETLLALSVFSAYRGASAIDSGGHQDTRGDISYPGEVFDRETSRHIIERSTRCLRIRASFRRTDRQTCMHRCREQTPVCRVDDNSCPNIIINSLFTPVVPQFGD